MNLTNNFIHSIQNMKNSAITNSTFKQAKRCLLDYLGATLAGGKILKEKNKILLEQTKSKANEGFIIGLNQKTCTEQAMFINGLNSHAAELDDGIRYGMIHPGAPVFSALLPIAARKETNSEDFLKSIIIGYESEIRIAHAIQPSHYKKGYHPTSTCGTIGAAYAIATLLNFSNEQIKNTISAAAVSAAGMLKVIEDGSEIKPMNVGRAALNGYLAALLGQAGFKGIQDVFSGETGFLKMMADYVDVSILIPDSAKIPSIEKIYIKPYAACRHAHPSIEAAIFLRSEMKENLNNIKKIRIKTYDSVIGKHDHTDINGVPSAKMSIPFSTALALYTGKAGITEYSSEFVNNTDIQNLTKSVEVHADEEISKAVPDKRAAIVEIETHSGKIYSKKIDYPKGEPENPMSDQELEQKFFSAATFAEIPNDTIKKIISCVWNLENHYKNLFTIL